MATITPSTTYPDGTTLNVTGHNANIYSTVAGKGILSEPNGGLQQVNLDAAFQVRADHVMAEEAVRARQDSLTTPMDIYSNGFGTLLDVDGNYVAIGGLCHRAYIPFDVDALVWEWSFFLAAFRPAVTAKETAGGAAYTPDVVFRVYVDGTEFPAMRRQPPVSARVSSTISETANAEAVSANWYDFTHLQKNVSKGFHDVAVKVYIQPPVDQDTKLSLDVIMPGNWISPTYGPTDEVAGTLHQRVTLGTRSVRCVMFR
jgi:hypothetical protein